MFKLLFLPRGYLTFLILFYAYQTGWMERVLQSTDTPSATAVLQWFDSARPPSPTPASRPEQSAPSVEELKSEILQELTRLEQEARAGSEFQTVTPQRTEPNEIRSEVPTDIQGYFHRMLR